MALYSRLNVLRACGSLNSGDLEGMWFYIVDEVLCYGHVAHLIAVNRGRGLPIILKVMGLWRTTHMNIIILASYVLYHYHYYGILVCTP